MEIANKRVLVTGGAVRIGNAICRAFAKAGAKVILHYNQSKTEAEALLAEISDISSGHSLVQGNFLDGEFVNGLISSVKPVDILINNASVFNMVPFADETLDAAKKQFDINFWAPVTLMRHFYNQDTLKEGCIINFLDRRITKTELNGASYPLSKKSLAEATKACACQWAPKVRVNAIAPGVVLPPVGKEHFTMQKELATVPTGKPVALEDITASCLFLAENDSVNGQILFLDGGQHLR